MSLHPWKTKNRGKLSGNSVAHAICRQRKQERKKGGLEKTPKGKDNPHNGNDRCSDRKRDADYAFR